MKRNQWARLIVTDGTEIFDLLTSPVCLKDWEPAIAQKREIRKQSFQSDGSIPVDYSWDNINDVFVLDMKGKDADALARSLQDLHRLLLKGLAYWATSWQKEPVWIEARAQHETNVRYAHIVSFQTEKDNNPFAQPFFSTKSYRREFNLGIEHKHWAANAPGLGPCIEISGTQDWAMSYPLVYDGATQLITVPAAASLNDLPDNAVAGKGPITVHGWIKADGYGEANVGRIAKKGSDNTATRGWHLHLSAATGLIAIVDCATQDAQSRSGLDEFTADGEWQYVLMTYSETGARLPAARTIYLNIGGAWVTSYTVQQVSIGNYAQDTADDFIIGNAVAATATFDGEIGWMEVKDYIIRTPDHGDFDPPPRCPLPSADAGSAFLGIYEGDGTAIDDLGPNGNDGTAANDEWGDGCEIEFGRGGTSVDDGIFPIVYNGVDQVLTIPAAASINDLPDSGVHIGGVITVHGWIKAYGYGEGNSGRIAIKGSSGTPVRGWHFHVSSTSGLVGRVDCATQDALSTSGLDEFTADGEWHHVLMLYNEAVADGGMPAIRTVFLAVAGVWVASYATQDVSIGNYSPDNGDDLLIGNNWAAATATFDGEIGWMEVVEGAPYLPSAGNFTPPSRCPLPDPHALSAFLGIHEGAGTHIEDLSGNDNIGTLVNDVWGDACGAVITDDPDCADGETYIANKHNMAQLTHVFVDNGGAFGPNLIGGALPFNLLPAVPVANDAIYFGIDTTLLNSGPFCSLVFDILAAQTGITSIIWEYWSSAGPGWAALTVQDNTNADGFMTGDAFDTVGVASVHWEQPPLWIAVDLSVAAAGALAITGFWIRARVAVAAAATAPTQQNRNIYSILWPHVDIASDQVLGDIEAIARTVLKNQADRDGSGGAGPDLYANRAIIALRSLDRGEDFTPYINLSDEQNNANLSIFPGASSAFSNNVETPTGRQITITNRPALWGSSVTIQFEAELAVQYRGGFHAYLRGEQTSGAAGDIQLRLRIGLGGAGGYSRLAPRVVTFGAVGTDDIVLDFGGIKIPSSDSLLDIDNTQSNLFIEAFGDGAADCNLYDLILVPIDEWAGDYRDIVYRANSLYLGGGAGTKIDIDGIGYPKHTTRALLRFGLTDSVLDIYKAMATTPILQANKAQRLWFFTMFASAPPTDDLAKHEIADSIQEFSNARYLSARGDR